MKSIFRTLIIVLGSLMNRSCGSIQETNINTALHTSTYDIISSKDIANIASITKQKPLIQGFGDDNGGGIARWQCYSTEHLQRFCEDGTDGNHSNLLEDNFIPAYIRIVVPNPKGHVQIFLPQGTRNFEDCPEYLNSLDAFLAKDSHICFETHFYFGEIAIPHDLTDKFPGEAKASKWHLWQLKNKSGYWQDREPTEEELHFLDEYENQLAKELSLEE